MLARETKMLRPEESLANTKEQTTTTARGSRTPLRAGIFGGSGYGGAELLRLLLFHPFVEVVLATANEHAGKAVGEVHRNLYGLTDLRFQHAPEDFDELASLDCLFLALPHGQAMEIVPRLPENLRVVDLSGDFGLI